MIGNIGGRKAGRNKRRWDEMWTMYVRRCRVWGELGEREKWSWRVSSRGWNTIRAIKEPIYQLTYLIYKNVEKGSTVIDRYGITTLITQWTDFAHHNPVTFRQDVFNDALASICHC